MDFELSDVQQAVYEYGGKLAKKYDRKYWLAKADKHEFPREMWQQVADDGYLGLMVPEEYGGAGLGMQELALLMEGMSDHGIPLLMLVVSSCMALGPLAKHGTPEQKRRYLPDACAGKTTICFAITEPNAGTNSMKISTLARESNGAYYLNGQKTFISGADVADHCLVVARTTPYDKVKRKTDGFTLFMVDMKSKGLERTLIPISIRAPETQWQLFFDDIVLGPENVLGEVGKGFDILFDSLNPERVILAAMCVGLGRYAMTQAVDYANTRNVFGQPIGAYQGLQHPLAAAKTEIEMAALMTRKAGWLIDQNRPAAEAANMAKYYAAEASIRAVDAAAQCFGGNAFTREYGIFDLYPLVRLMRTAPVNREMILNFIGEKVMGLPRSY
jgi:acyl-CoA dehydrogenase